MNELSNLTNEQTKKIHFMRSAHAFDMQLNTFTSNREIRKKERKIRIHVRLIYSLRKFYMCINQNNSNTVDTHVAWKVIKHRKINIFYNFFPKQKRNEIDISKKNRIHSEWIIAKWIVQNDQLHVTCHIRTAM